MVARGASHEKAPQCGSHVRGQEAHSLNLKEECAWWHGFGYGT
jgi:hypothetical protein